jgi:hypothetical protein
MSNPDTRVIIYPSILLAVANANLEEMYQAAKDKLDKYTRGGEDRAEAYDDEETD